MDYRLAPQAFPVSDCLNHGRSGNRRTRSACTMRLLAFLAFTLIVAGCQTSTQSLFTISGPGWRIQEGQALWRPGRQYPELGGEIVVATHDDGRCLVEFSKTPLPLVQAQTMGTHWLVRFPPRNMGFEGRHSPPSRFGWLYLRPALAGEKLPSSFRFQRLADGGWRLENVRSGESLAGFLSP